MLMKAIVLTTHPKSMIAPDASVDASVIKQQLLVVHSCYNGQEVQVMLQPLSETFSENNSAQVLYQEDGSLELLLAEFSRLDHEELAPQETTKHHLDKGQHLWHALPDTSTSMRMETRAESLALNSGSMCAPQGTTYTQNTCSWTA
jgi:hypothetical protein